MSIITLIWNTVLVNPMTNILVLLNNTFFGSFGLAIRGRDLAGATRDERGRDHMDRRGSGLTG